MTVVTTMNFDDAGAFSKALSRSNVMCMQSSSGTLQFGLTIVTLPELELHLTSMPVGACIALGDTAKDSVSFHVALSDGRSLNLMGAPAETNSFAAYAHGGELAIKAESGARLAYIVPSSKSTAELYEALSEDNAAQKVRQFYRGTIGTSELNSLKALLGDIAQIIDRSPAVLNHRATARNLAQSLLVQTFLVARKQLAASTPVDRPQRGYVQTVKRVHDYLRQCPPEPVYVLDLCRLIGISQPTLFRAFTQTLGIGPKEYLQIRRLHLSRQRLLHPDHTDSFQDVAHDLGFWHLGRFSMAYRAMFGETPSNTLRRRVRSRHAL
jgi:AraC-like DNA-binding protein